MVRKFYAGNGSDTFGVPTTKLVCSGYYIKKKSTYF